MCVCVLVKCSVNIYLSGPFGLEPSVGFTILVFCFCLDDLFIGESGVKKSPTISV